ncbi:MAG: hypothetical protein J6Q22_13535 [Prevotella sp.]|nr:hypothetical protein [Prevotella sp.]
MKKLLVISVSTMLMLSSCGTYTGSGAATGGYFGSIIGSAIGGISGGWRGSDIGSLVGLAGGAVVGAAIGAAADEAEQQKYEDYKAQRQERIRNMQRRDDPEPAYDNSGFDSSNSGDDRLFGFDENFGSAPTPAPISGRSVEIRNPHFVDASRDGVLVRGEEARMVFEVFNNSDKPVYRILPTVVEVTGNKHIHISQNVLVESIMPGKGIRYTAIVKADDRLRDGDAVIRIGVMQGNKDIPSQSREYRIKTSRR